MKKLTRYNPAYAAADRTVTGEKAYLRLLLVLFLSIFLSSCETIKHMMYTHDPLNFHVVKEGELYRSAQPGGSDLRRIHQEYGIKSVINLRGEHEGERWYDKEVAVTNELGLKRVDIPMLADQLPTRENLLALLDAFNDLPLPILIHCKAGSDRTGEAAALYAMDHLQWSRRTAAGQLHPYFGHFPDFLPAKTYFVREVYKGEKWARSGYFPCHADYQHYDREKFCGN